MQKRLVGLTLAHALFLLLLIVTVVPGVAQANEPNPTNEGLPVVTGNAYGLILGAALIVAVIFAGVAFRRRKS